MSTNGVMEEIRELLNEGRNSSEVIALGYAPSSVYKAQRQLRQSATRPGQPLPQLVVNNLASEGWTELKEENAALRQQVSLHEEIAAERDALREELDLARTQMEELEGQVTEMQQLRERLSSVETEARAAGLLRQQVQGLENEISRLNSTISGKDEQWWERLEREQEARREAEAQASTNRSEADRLRDANQELNQYLEQLPGRFSAKLEEVRQPLLQELEKLRPLKVWTGHPCVECGKLMESPPSRETAARVMREAGIVHGACIKKRRW